VPFAARKLLQARLERGTATCLVVVEVVGECLQPLAVLAALAQLLECAAHVAQALRFDLHGA
jgi:hypothetical protein